MKKNSLRVLTAVLVVLMLAVQLWIPALAATTYCSVCGDKGVKGDLLYTIDPTCGTDGYAIYECDAVIDNKACTGTITERVPATGVHVSDGETVDPVAPSCTEDGTIAYELCVDCGCYLDPTTGDKLDSIVDPQLGHDHVGTPTNPTCTEDGYTTYVCSRCEDTYVEAGAAATNHDFSVLVQGQPATCREEGFSDYYICSVCDAEDPERPKTVEPVADHNLALIDHEDATCTKDGKNVFKCDEPTCPYYNTITETLKKLGHKTVNHAAKEATCYEMGYAAYKTCERCDYTTYKASSEEGPYNHDIQVSVGYIAPTCTTTGCTDAIKCARCNEILHPGEEIAATGHDLKAVSPVAATCTTTGKIAHQKCKTCNKLYAADVTNDDITAVALTTAQTVIAKLGHDYEDVKIEPTCTEVGYIVHTCQRDNCTHTYSDIVAATGHTFTVVEEVPAECLADGTASHNKCDVCGEIFALDVKEDDIEAAPIDPAELVLTQLGHAPEVVSKVNPTYDAAGNEAGERCSRCGDPLLNANYLDELNEAVKFYYTIDGVNGSDIAVNSGYITLNIYFEVLADLINDKEEYNSDVLANIFGVDYALSYDSSAFTLTDVIVAPGAFAKASFTPLAIANSNGTVAITQDMVTGSKAFRGTNLFATLTFQVSADADATDYYFDLANLNVVHPDADETIDVSESVTSVDVEVKALGDANGDGIFTSHDTLSISNYIKDADIDTEYVAEYDMDKNGVIDFTDLDLLRKAIVGNTEYLDIVVNPNQIAQQEVFIDMSLKKIFSIFLAAAIIISTLTLTLSASEENTEIFMVEVEAVTTTSTISSSPIIYNQDEEITVKLSASQNTGITSLKLFVDYDENLLEVVESKTKALNLFTKYDDLTAKVSKSGDGYLIFYSDNYPNISTATGAFAEITFVVKQTCTEQSAITITTYQNSVGNCQVQSVTGLKPVPFQAKNLEFSIHAINTADSVVTAPTCTEEGYTTHFCNECNKDVKGNIVAALGHTEAEAVEENRVEPTCVDKGSYDTVVYCSVCNAELSRVANEIAALGHTEAEAVEENRVEAGCVDKGSYDTVVYCSVCNEELSREAKEIDALGHTAGEAVEENRVEPTCVDKGSYDSVVYCSVCNEELSREAKEIDALGHDAVAHEAQDPTCTEIGWDAYDTCSRCDYTTYVEKDALGHAYGESTTVEPEYKKEGYTVHTCTVCDYEEKYDIVPALTYILGDTNGNEIVDSDDAINLLYHTLLPESNPVNQECDFNGDGIVDSDDAIYLLYHTLLPEQYPLNK